MNCDRHLLGSEVGELRAAWLRDLDERRQSRARFSSTRLRDDVDVLGVSLGSVQDDREPADDDELDVRARCRTLSRSRKLGVAEHPRSVTAAPPGASGPCPSGEDRRRHWLNSTPIEEPIKRGRAEEIRTQLVRRHVRARSPLRLPLRGEPLEGGGQDTALQALLAQQLDLKSELDHRVGVDFLAGGAGSADGRKPAGSDPAVERGHRDAEKRGRPRLRHREADLAAQLTLDAGQPAYFHGIRDGRRDTPQRNCLRHRPLDSLCPSHQTGE